MLSTLSLPLPISKPTRLDRALALFADVRAGEGAWSIDRSELARYYHVRVTNAANWPKATQTQVFCCESTVPGARDHTYRYNVGVRGGSGCSRSF